MNTQAKTVPVIGLDGKLAGYVSRDDTSIGASKVAKAPACQMTCRLGIWMWVATTQTGYDNARF